ncbi:hypothetical protein PHYBOEH_007196 [Phytophthora boehmeriae]|uniref:CLASP N-terminal domain-containing protein n=1 Tax=Phytophthora boehmeriae TaxID=109152 RepID=A0A8T1WB13_9STRA|nr:hypothetical protein PHYBOEH_007196 [Phytophthora boehmeriae]
MEQLYRQVQQAGKVLQGPDVDWADNVEAMEGVAVAVEGLGSSYSRKEAVQLLMSISGEIGVQLTSIRSKLVKEVCERLLRIVKETGKDFEELANALLPQIVQTAKNSSFAVRQPGAKLLGKVSELVRYDLSLMRKIFVQSTQEKVRVLLLDQLMIIFVFWTDDEYEAWDSDVLEMMRRGLEDQSEKVRKTARETLMRFLTRWIERVNELLDMPSQQAKMLLISEHPDSSLSAALLEKYPELVNKAEALSRSRSMFAKRRSNYLQSPRRRQSDEIEIHVTTPPSKPRNLQSSRVREADKDVVARPGTSQQQNGALSRRLFDETTPLENFGDDHEESAREAFDGSQMYGYSPKYAESKAQKRSTKNMDSPTRQPLTYRSIPMDRPRSASNAAAIVDDSNSLQVDWHQHDEFLQNEYLQNENATPLHQYEKEEANEEEQPVISRSDNTRKDALAGLLDVRAGMARLRAETRNGDINDGLPLKNYCEFMPNSDQIPSSVGESLEQQSSVQRDSHFWDMSQKAEPSYLDRLAHADQYERDSQQKKAVLGGYAQDQPVENFLVGGNGQLTSQPEPFERIEKRSDVYKEKPQEARYPIPRAEFTTERLPALQEAVPLPESSRPREQAARFEDAEKLIAATQLPEPRSHRYYERPLSPEPERYFNTEPLLVRSPPTRMGPKLNPALANANNVVDSSKKDDTSKVNVPKPKPEQHSEATSLERTPDRIVPSVVGTSPTQGPVSNRDDPRTPSNPPTTMRDRVVPPPARLGWVSSAVISVLLFFAGLFCLIGTLRAAWKMRDSEDYHLALEGRIDMFEASIAESHEKVHRLEEDFAIWNEYVRKLAEEDEANALMQLEVIQLEVQKWQQDMKADLLEFRQALSTDSIDTALAALQ